MYNLLSEPLIRMEGPGGQQDAASLPEVYSALVADKVEAFPALRPHQRHAWHAFLVQLGVIAMQHGGLCDLPREVDEWRRIIRSLTPDFVDDEPWQLVVDDISKPAFMQPQASSRDREADFKNPVTTPDELDMLVTAKNHDLKSAVAVQAGTDDWIFALITLQTMEGFGGANNYGISRMNGGLGNRAAFSLAPASGRVGAHVARDIVALTEFLPDIVEGYPHYDTVEGPSLLWAIPWDGTAPESRLPTGFHPLYIEVCRRVRLKLQGGVLCARRTTSRAARIEGKELKGRTGDPWTPVDPKREGVPLTLGAGGFNYKRIRDYLMKWGRPVLLKPTRAERQDPTPMQLVARATVRGQGKTEGHYERSVPVGHRLKTALRGGDGMQEIGDIAEKRIEQVGIVQRILSHAIQTFAARGEANNVNAEGRKLAGRWLNRLDGAVDATFFDELQREFEAAEQDRQVIRNEWLRERVVGQARVLLRDAIASLPCPAIHRYKAAINAEGLLEGRLRSPNGLPFLFDTTEREEEA